MQLTSHYLGFGSLPIDTMSPKGQKYITQQEGSGKFKEKLMLQQRKMEQLLVENRVKKLKQDEERLQKQIRIANKHSEMADATMRRREEDRQLKEAMAKAEADRIARQNKLNHERKM